MLGDITSYGALPALEASMRFAAARHPLILNNIANLSTPDYRPMDVSVEGFQKALRQAIDERRTANGGQSGSLPLSDSREVGVLADGRLALRPSTPSDNILFHDRNNRDLERTMQSLVENSTVFRVSTELIKNRFDLLRSAIAERV